MSLHLASPGLLLALSSLSLGQLLKILLLADTWARLRLRRAANLPSHIKDRKRRHPSTIPREEDMIWEPRVEPVKSFPPAGRSLGWSPWPAEVDGAPCTIGAFTTCTYCEVGTWARYDVPCCFF